MNDQELRALVRAAVERHLGSYPQPAARSPQPDASHYVYVSVTNVSDACVIEPNVPCNHCNYCKSHGH